MSEPIRYTQNIKCVEPSYHAQNICSGMVECSIGEWVLHSDYARLKAENERLRKAIQKFQAVAPNASNPCGCGFWTCETKDLLKLNDALEGKQS